LGTGFAALRPFFLALLADTSAAMGDSARALHLLDEALALADRSVERWYVSELHRRYGELLLMRHEDERGETALLRALEVAHSQSARLFELRSATRLGLLWKQQGRVLEARQLLAPLYAWFDEGLDTPDLIAARRLLDALAS
jgi:predicted ATPase